MIGHASSDYIFTAPSINFLSILGEKIFIDEYHGVG
jgi:hypothetical protein